MYDRLFQFPNKSCFLFGPRGVGKSSLIRDRFSSAIIIDLLKSETYNYLKANPTRIEEYIDADTSGIVVIDEVQKIPELLDEVHRLIEARKVQFILSGSSARQLRQKGVNLLAGRARVMHLHPLLAEELQENFSLTHSLQYGFLPAVYVEDDPEDFLQSYVRTYIDEEVKQEGLTRNISSFYRFLEAASFSQGSPLNMSSVARECSVHRKVVTEYFNILEDLLLANRLAVFSKKAKRAMRSRLKFYFFDSGVYRAIRPKGPLDAPEEIDGIALETIVYQQLRAHNDYYQLGYELFYWHTRDDDFEVDFVLYGERGIKAFEVKRSKHISGKDLKGLKAFKKDYPDSDTYLLYGGEDKLQKGGITALPVEEFLTMMGEYV